MPASANRPGSTWSMKASRASSTSSWSKKPGLGNRPAHAGQVGIDPPPARARREDLLVVEDLDAAIHRPAMQEQDRPALAMLLVVDRGLVGLALHAAPGHSGDSTYSARRNATRSCLLLRRSASCSSTRLKNSTVSSSVSSRPSCRYGGESLMPRSGKVLIGPSADGHAAVDHLRLEEALGLQVVHQVVGVVRRRVAGRRTGPCRRTAPGRAAPPRVAFVGIELADRRRASAPAGSRAAPGTRP